MTILLCHEKVNAHVKWVYPPPRPADDVKNFPCGANSVWGSGPVTEMSVGLNEVIFDEFICHRGDMVRIALSMGSDNNYDSHVLLDRLPHNDLCGTTTNDFMAVNVTLPDVDCVTNECSMQIIQVMTSKFKGQTCSNPNEIASLCGGGGRMYYSCARVKIQGAAPSLPVFFNDFYGSPLPVDYEWPLVEDWCRDNREVPWKMCGTTRQAEFIEPPAPSPSPSRFLSPTGTESTPPAPSIAPSTNVPTISPEGRVSSTSAPTISPNGQVPTVPTRAPTGTESTQPAPSIAPWTGAPLTSKAIPNPSAFLCYSIGLWIVALLWTM